VRKMPYVIAEIAPASACPHERPVVYTRHPRGGRGAEFDASVSFGLNILIKGLLRLVQYQGLFQDRRCIALGTWRK